ncbi:ABC transporter substrate-binding protein [Fontibacter flavus]|uniref:ABC transporter substrate-binding protein n=1 Tax=Fontibacter flavus TaxID=654838 RepID=A0ABV6FPN6_9BACT
MPQFIDQLNRSISLPLPPKLIVSLVPSQTELLVDLGLRDRVKGVTKFCVHPKGLKKEKIIIGGTKNFHFDKIDALQPDLIIGNKEENYQEGIERLSEKYPVWMSDIYTLEDAFGMMLGIGAITGTAEKAAILIQQIRQDMDALVNIRNGTAVYLIWKDPLMGVGPQTFIHDMLGRAGFENVISKPRYPEITIEELKTLSPNFLFLSSEPYPFKEKHVKEFSSLLPNTRVLVVDGEMFSWYGSRLSLARAYFLDLALRLTS